MSISDEISGQGDKVLAMYADIVDIDFVKHMNCDPTLLFVNADARVNWVTGFWE